MRFVSEHTWIFWKWSTRESDTVEDLPTFFLGAPEPNVTMRGMVLALFIIRKLYKAIATEELIVIPGKVTAGNC